MPPFPITSNFSATTNDVQICSPRSSRLPDGSIELVPPKGFQTDPNGCAVLPLPPTAVPPDSSFSISLTFYATKGSEIPADSFSFGLSYSANILRVTDTCFFFNFEVFITGYNRVKAFTASLPFKTGGMANNWINNDNRADVVTVSYPDPYLPYLAEVYYDGRDTMHVVVRRSDTAKVLMDAKLSDAGMRNCIWKRAETTGDPPTFLFRASNSAFYSGFYVSNLTALSPGRPPFVGDSSRGGLARHRGIIAGATIGGMALLALIGLAVFFFAAQTLRRRQQQQQQQNKGLGQSDTAKPPPSSSSGHGSGGTATATAEPSAIAICVLDSPGSHRSSGNRALLGPSGDSSGSTAAAAPGSGSAEVSVRTTTASRAAAAVVLQRFTPQQVSDALGPQPWAKVGSGGYGDVYRGRLQPGGEDVAIKVLHTSLQEAGLTDDALDAELQAHSLMRHQRVVALLGYCRESRALVFEYMSGGSLDRLLFGGAAAPLPPPTMEPLLPWRSRLRIAHQVTLGLGHLHNMKPIAVLHR